MSRLKQYLPGGLGKIWMKVASSKPCPLLTSVRATEVCKISDLVLKLIDMAAYSSGSPSPLVQVVVGLDCLLSDLEELYLLSPG